MGDSNYQQVGFVSRMRASKRLLHTRQVLRKYAARVDDYQNIYTTGTLSQ